MRRSPHANAPLTPEGRHRLIERCRTRPIAHVAAEMGISRATASKWVNRYRQFGEVGLLDRSSTPLRQPSATDSGVVARIERARREHKWSAARIEFIPDGGGWRIHGRDSPEARAVERTKKRGARCGYVYLHSAIDGHTRLAYTESLEDEKGVTTAEFLERAKTWFAAHGIGAIERIVTDNGACYRSKVFAEAVLPARHQRITPYTPRHNGKVERYNRILAEEFLYARAWRSEGERADGLLVWNLHYNYHRPHGAHDGQPPAKAAPTAVNNVLASYT